MWTSPTEQHRLPTEAGHVSLRCPKCACIASYPSDKPTVQCSNCRATLRVPTRENG
jgi:RNase P subunit RPR2